jgi:signal transduction histidine kinase
VSFRGRLLAAMGALAIVPLAVIALGLRHEMTERLTAQYERRVEGLAGVAREDLDREGASIANRLAAVTSAMRDDNRFRLGVVSGAPAEREYVLDYAGRAMHAAGFAMLQIQDETGRIVSSGHFRNEYGRLEPELPALLADARGAALASARTPEGPILVLARVDSLAFGARRLFVLGGTRVDRGFLASMARGDELAVTLVAGGQRLSSDSLLEGDSSLAASGELPVATVNVPYIGTDAQGERHASDARLVITHPTAELLALRRNMDRWFLAAIALAAAAALGLSAWLAGALSRPLTELAERTKRVDLDTLDANFATDRTDELGALSRTLGAMTRRLRSSAAALREAERRATVGDLARQVNHDIKNGLAPIRNVLRHLGEVAEEDPLKLPTVFGERRHTLDASVAYLDNLARNYARLSPRLDSRPCDANEIARQVAASAPAGSNAAVETSLANALPRVAADPLVLRRILENLVSNALDSIGPAGGSVTIATESVGGSAVRITVTDSGCGMTEEELARAFDDFHTTKRGGTGLGLSIVRRLVADLHGSLRIETEPGVGTTAIVTLDAAAGAAQLPRDASLERSRT